MIKKVEFVGQDRRRLVRAMSHGGGENDARWSANQRQGGYANLILDNLIAAGRARPMIIAITVQIDIGTVEVVRLALRGVPGRGATRPTSVPMLL